MNDENSNHVAPETTQPNPTTDSAQRDDVAVAMKALGDAQAREIYASGHSNAQKIELLGHHMFKKLWLGRYVPEETPAPASPGAPQSNQIQPNPA